MKIIVTQIGARHRYSVPLIFEKAGLLERLYTDSSSHSFLGKISKWFGFINNRIRKLSNRKIEGIPTQKIYSTDIVLLKEFIKKSLNQREHYYWKHKILSKKAIQWGLGNADAVFHMSVEYLDFIKYAKSKSKTIITDVFISPITDEIMLLEQQKFHFLNSVNYTQAGLDKYRKQFEEVINLSDVLLCPSDWVAQGILKINKSASHKIKIVPYGNSLSFKAIKNNPIKGRVLFVGYDILRKGLPYLAQAATLIKQKYPELDFRIAGITRQDVSNHDMFKDLNFLGKLHKSDLEEEYSTADCFILPTFSEGMAGVLVEAMSAGLPIIATNNAGITVEDEVNGLLVQPGSVDDICKAVEKIYCNRLLREQLSKKAIEQASQFTIESWEQRLVKMVNDI